MPEKRHASSSLLGEFMGFLPIGHGVSMFGRGAHRMIGFVFLSISAASVRLRNQWTWRNPNEHTDAQGGVTRGHTWEDGKTVIRLWMRKHLRLTVRSP